MEHLLLWMLHRASLQMKSRSCAPTRAERQRLRLLARRFRSQVDGWWLNQLRFEKCDMRNLDKLRPAQIRAEIVEQLSADSWTPEAHVFSCVLNTPGVTPIHGVTKLRAALRYLQRQGKIAIHTPLHSDGQVRWKLINP